MPTGDPWCAACGGYLLAHAPTCPCVTGVPGVYQSRTFGGDASELADLRATVARLTEERDEARAELKRMRQKSGLQRRELARLNVHLGAARWAVSGFGGSGIRLKLAQLKAENEKLSSERAQRERDSEAQRWAVRMIARIQELLGERPPKPDGDGWRLGWWRDCEPDPVDDVEPLL